MPRLRPTLALLALAVVPAPTAGQIALADGESATLTVGGYVRTLTGIHDRGYDIPDSIAALTGAPPRQTGFHGQVVRLKWQAEGGGAAGAGARWRVDVHNRLQARVSSAEVGSRIVGFGVSRLPDRWIDLESDLLTEPGLRVWHDLDRLSLTLYAEAADVTVGRQAITWGLSAVFPVADLWTRFSPFELDTEEKPGIDALRVLAYPASGLELDLVVADRGRLEDLSAGLRGSWSLSGADLWLGGGKLWREVMAMGGVAVLLEETKLRAEAVLPWALDAGELLDPRITVGVDWFRSTFALTGEYHYNGIGSPPGRYRETLRDPRFERGETYYLGRHYLGGVASWNPDREQRLTLALNALANLRDPSLALTPALRYDVGQATRIAVGGLLSLGDAPSFATIPPRLPSEFGAYGTLGYTQLSVYF